MPERTDLMTFQRFMEHPAGFNKSGMYVIWSHEHQAWWAPQRRGYVKNLNEAGVYTHLQAADITLDTIPAGVEVAIPVTHNPATARIWGRTKES